MIRKAITASIGELSLALACLVSLAAVAWFAPTIEYAYALGALASLIHILLNYRAGYLWSLRLIPPIAFLYVFLPDAFNYGASYVGKFFPFDYLVQAARLINFGYILFLCGIVAYDAFANRSQIRPGSAWASPQTRLPGFWLSIILLAAYLPTMLPFALVALVGGRIEASSDISFIFTFLTSVTIFNAGLLAHGLRSETSPIRRIMCATALAVTLFVIFASGTRFFLLFAASALFCTFVDFDPKRERRQFHVVLVLALPFFVSLALLSNVMVLLRGGETGLSDALSASILPKGEDILSYFAMLIAYFERNEFMYGWSHLSMLWFWIPRIVWPSKPTYIEHSVVHSFDFSSGFSEGHSGAFGFLGSAYADFGLAGICILAPLYGLALARLDNSFRRWMQGNDHLRLIAAFLPGVIFFAMRQLSTAFFFAAAIVLLALVVRAVTGLFSDRRRSSWTPP